MIYSKIDSRLLKESTILDERKKIKCLIKAEKFESLKGVLTSKKIKIIDEYLFIKSFFVEVTREQLFYLSRLASVKHISSFVTAQTLMNVSRKVLKVDDISLSGKGVGVAFIDTGIKKHYDFCLGANRIKKFVDFVNSKPDAYDDNGHGTFVAGVCSGSGAQSCGKFQGIAPQSDIYALKALDKNGEAYSNKILSAMEWIFDSHKRLNIKVVCMSFGSEPLGVNDPIMLGAEELWKSGVTVVVAAGNNGPQFQSIKSPGVSRKLITVGGMDDNRYDDNNFSPALFEIAPFSSRGPSFMRFKPDIVAPSVDIISCGTEQDYITLSGTSVATPMIAGAVCLMLEKNISLRPDEIKAKLLSSCTPITYNKNLEGYGYPSLAKLLD